MFAKLLLLFIVIPFVEVIILIKLGAEIGFSATVIIVVVTGILGASLARFHGLSVWYQIRQELQQGRMPAGKLVDGLLILIGGIVLLTPGLLTDLCGIVLLIPTTRNIIKRWLWKKFEIIIGNSQTGVKPY